MRFRKGDRLVVRETFIQSSNIIHKGYIFDILGVEGASYMCEFDEKYFFDLHHLDNRCMDGYGYYITVWRVDEHAEPLSLNPDWEV
jgi:hypothetical protein